MEERKEEARNEEADLKEKREKIVAGIKSFFSGKSSESEEDSSEMAEKRKKLIQTFKEKKSWLIVLALIAIIIFGCYIRTQNFWLLKDVTTGAWLSTDLDSHIYLKYAKVILEKGYLPDIDYTRFVPMGAPTANYAFPAYFIFGMYSIMKIFNHAITIEYVDVIYPIFCFAIGLIFFFLLARKLFETKVALLSTLLLAIIPAFLQRTMGGSSDHDALGMMFMFISLYIFLLAWQNKHHWKALGWGALAGIATGMTGLSWGAWKFLALIFGTFVLLEFLLQKVESRQIYVYALWLVVSIITMIAWVPLITLQSLIKSIPTAIPLVVLLVLIVDFLLFKLDVLKLKKKLQEKVPTPLISVLVSVLLGIILLVIVLGPTQVAVQFNEAKLLLLHPMGKDRWELTVAEQHQPYFTDILASFGPSFGPGAFSLPLLFTFFLVGLILFNYQLFKAMKKRITFTLLGVVFFLLIFISRYKAGETLNGVTFWSQLLYFGSFVGLGGLFIYYYWTSFKKDKEAHHHLLQWKSASLYLLIWLLFMVVAARGAIRLIFVVAPVIVLLGAYGIIQLMEMIFTIKKKAYLYLAGAALLLLLLSPFAYPYHGLINDYTQNSLKQAQYSGPPYDQQWQIAGQWVKENMAEDAVFGHWWDYGYWVQNGFERASVLDGANKVKYWNYLMGRHVLTGETEREALEFLYAHNTSHFLIVSDEIGKYTAYSSIGSDGDYDRYSWITTFTLNEQATQETRNTTVYVYQGGYVLDGDFVWEKKVYPRQNAGIGAVFLPTRQVQRQEGNETVVSLQFEQPSIALIYNNQRVDVPLECLYFNGEIVKFSKPGYKGCLRLVPTLSSNGQLDNPLGAGLFVSEKGMKALWVNLYVFDQNNPEFPTTTFKSVYNDKYLSEIIYYPGRGVMGPIKIWEVDYPQGFTISEELRQKYLGGNDLLPDYFFEVN